MIRRVLRKFLPAQTPKEKARKHLFSLKLKRGDTAVDCGANVGDITRHLCRYGATVYCFEPNPHAFEVLQKRFSGMENVHCMQKGVSDTNGKMKLYMHRYTDEDAVKWSTGSSLLSFKRNVCSDKYVEVEVIDLCEFIESLNGRVRVLKMDVEGVECGILRKMIAGGSIEKIDQVFVETHDLRVPQLKAETDAIRDLIKKKGIRNINLHWT